MFHNGWLGECEIRRCDSDLEAGAKARTDEVNGAATVTLPLAPMRKEDAPDPVQLTFPGPAYGWINRKMQPKLVMGIVMM